MREGVKGKREKASMRREWREEKEGGNEEESGEG